MQKIMVFGRGAYYRGKKEGIESRYHIIGFLDNAVLEVTQEDGTPVYPPDTFAERGENVPVLIAALDVFRMYKQLKTLGIEDERILFAQDIKPSWDTLEKRMADAKCRMYAENGSLMLEYDGQEHRMISETQYRETLRDFLRRQDGSIDALCSLKPMPVDRRFGRGTGTPIDRIYIERFLKQNAEYIHGDVLEMANNRYTKMFDGGEVTNSHVAHVYGWNDAIKMNLATGEGIVENSMDCFICTQTIQMIYELEKTVENIYKLLKPEGNALITISGISQISPVDYENWGECWRMTAQSARTLFEKYFEADKVEVCSYGNVKTACCHLYDLSAEFLEEADFAVTDEQYPLILGVRACK